MIYLDNAATTFYKPSCVYHTLSYLTKHQSANAGHGGHDPSLLSNQTLWSAKNVLADFFHIENPDQIVLCQNTTLALNMGIQGVLSPGDHVIITSMEHNSVSRVAYAAAGVEVTMVSADKEGYIDPNDIENAIVDTTRLIVVNHASNVTGSVQDIETIGRIAKEHSVYFMVDCAQSAGIIDINVEKCHIDLLAFAGHKGLYGPLGTGGLYVKENVPLSPILFGGTGSHSGSQTMPDFMPDMLQAGTMNVPAFGALKSGVNFVKSHQAAIRQREEHYTRYLIDGLLNCPHVTVYGHTAKRRARVGVVSFTVAKKDTVAFANDLNDQYHIAVRAGLHCSPLAHQTIGTKQGGTIRASLGMYNTQNDIDRFLFAIHKLSQ